MTEILSRTPRSERLSEGLDFYKLTMGQLALEHFPGTEVTFTLKNRADQPLSAYVSPDELTERLDRIRQQGFTAEEIAYFAGLEAQDGSQRFDQPYLDYLASLTLCDVDVSLSETGDLAVQATGQWPNVSLWETIVMSQANEIYYENFLREHDLDPMDIWAEGDHRLNAKIGLLRDRPDIKIADFGTRRRFSAAWQEHVVARLAAEVPENLIGTSNPWYAYKFGLTPLGTYAHEMPMVYAALADAETGRPLDGHTQMMHDWFDRYGNDLSVALTDTFTTDFFFADFSAEQARDWRGLRHDSGDPIEFGERVIDVYAQHDIDPLTKTIVFSDGLDMATIVTLADHFQGRINLVFGWGTSLMNDLGLKANNFVMKATAANDTATVKLSDNAGKHTGPATQIERYVAQKDLRITQERAVLA